jgi:hypothetical protein
MFNLLLLGDCCIVDDHFLIETAAQLIILIKLVEFKNSLLELKCAANRFILFSNQNQKRIYRGVSNQKPSVSTARGVPWCFLVFLWCPVVFRKSLERKDFWGAYNRGVPWCFLGVPWCSGVFRT